MPSIAGPSQRPEAISRAEEEEFVRQPRARDADFTALREPTMKPLHLLRPLAALAVAASAAALAGACGSDDSSLAPGADAGPSALEPLEPSPPAIIPPSKRLDGTSTPVVFEPVHGGVWTANGDVGSISYVDIDTRKVVREIPIGGDVRSVALSPDFKWVAAVDRTNATVTLVDANTGVVARALKVGTHPRAAVWDAANPRWLYVAVEDDDSVTIVDRTKGAIEASIPVGRLPSGVAVSRKRRELYVTHLIDGKITIVDLAQRTVSVEVRIADEPENPDPKTPQGRPFAFESLAWAANGDLAWLPHELLAPTHPFAFDETLFPAISVADLATHVEVTTDPASPTGAVDGRKTLFAAINVLGPTGSPSIISQPCAAVLHPAGLVGYALACASEDLVVFDVPTGIATDLVRNLPGDHPVGLALDDKGQRLFIVSDQTHTLLTFDTGNGSIVARTTLRGDPIKLAANDPVDPEMRQGLSLFFRANSSKGTLATTANNWMACGGCHLDGLVSTNKFFFEALKPKDPTKDAQIGHVGLKDLFATAPAPHDASFVPHDILVALRDQGGLDGDRTGAHPKDVVDPAAPTEDAKQMAIALARVIARDLPVGPSWLIDRGTKPNPTFDGAWCGQCHQAEYQAWSTSVHAFAADDPMMLYCSGVEQELRGTQVSRLCAGCHDPVSARLGDTSLSSKRGVTCLGCHDVTRTIRAGGNADLEASAHDWTQDHKERATRSLETLRDPKFCGGCHEQFVPGTGLLPAFSTLSEWEASPFFAVDPAKQVRCVDCHMPKTGGVADHRSVGGNLYLGQRSGSADLVAGQTSRLKSFMALGARRSENVVSVDVQNLGAGHAFPTGVSDIREAWVELQAVDGSGKTVARIGGPGADGSISASAARLGTDIATPDGTVLLRHELSVATRLPFDRRVLPHETVTLTVNAPPALPAGAVRLDAVLLYRNLRTSYYRLALGDPNATPPETELARVKVP